MFVKVQNSASIFPRIAALGSVEARMKLTFAMPNCNVQYANKEESLSAPSITQTYRQKKKKLNNICIKKLPSPCKWVQPCRSGHFLFGNTYFARPSAKLSLFSFGSLSRFYAHLHAWTVLRGVFGIAAVNNHTPPDSCVLGCCWVRKRTFSPCRSSTITRNIGTFLYIFSSRFGQ